MTPFPTPLRSMSTLQISLAIAGGLLLILILAYNAWSVRRNAPKRALPTEADAALPSTATPRLDPAFEVPPVHGTDGSTEPVMHHVDARDALQSPLPTTLPDRRFGLDALIDVIAAIQPEQVVEGEAALAALPSTRRAGSKPFAVEGLNAGSQEWEQPRAGQRYQSFHAGVQMANRMGALNEIEFSEFVAKAQAFADAINAAVDFPDMLHEVARARELDQFANDHDAQLSFMVCARQAAWSSGYVEQNAARLGFMATPMPGRLALPASAGGHLPPLLTLAFDPQAAQAGQLDDTALRALTLLLEVPLVARDEQPFQRLRQVAAELCQSMDGVLCDQDGHPLPDNAMEAIASDLELLYDQLERRDFAAGSVLARRLFS